MISRLGKVLYWAACGVAGLIAAFGAVMVVVLSNSSNPIDVNSTWGVAVSFAAGAFLTWLIGRACRYVLSGY